MKVHHLNCATLCPIGGRLLSNSQGKLVCHCLLIETPNHGLVLIDTGLGTLDIQSPKKRLNIGHFLLNAKLDVNETALYQIQKLGFSAQDVKNIILTHLDYDHSGGIADFPDAKVHIFAPEFIAAMVPTTLLEKLRYRPSHWSHSPHWMVHQLSDGENWFGFECVKTLDNLPPEILLIPLIGHTWGHCGVAVQTSSGWLLHAGDAYFHRKEINKELKTKKPFLISELQRIVAIDHDSRVNNLELLSNLRTQKDCQINIFCSHDPAEFITNNLSSSSD